MGSICTFFGFVFQTAQGECEIQEEKKAEERAHVEKKTCLCYYMVRTSHGSDRLIISIFVNVSALGERRKHMQHN